MRSRLVRTVVVCLFVGALGMTGCKHMPWNKKKGAPGTGSGVDSVPPLTGTDIMQGDVRTALEGEVERGKFAHVFFDYDSARIKPKEMGKLETVADYLKANPGRQLIVEGHCDERGTAEYNRALGERRALAAREELVRLGIDPGRISTISYGFDKPIDLSHNETAWSANRRCEFVLAGR